MKDDRVCEYCTYKNVPTQFQPCIGCKEGNMDHLVKKEEKTEHGRDEQKQRNTDRKRIKNGGRQ